MGTAPTLRYDVATDKIWFPFENSTRLEYPFAFGNINGVYGVTWSARFPMARLGAAVFKGMYPDGKAMPDVIKILDKAKNMDLAINEREVTTPLEHLYRTEPYEHQRDAIECMMHYPRLALLLEQGLGKTFISIMATVFFRELGIPYKALIVCPNIVFSGWIEEIEKYSNLRVLPYKGSPKVRATQREAISAAQWDCVLTTFDMLTDRAGSNSYVLESVWTGLGASAQSTYAKRWLEKAVITQEQYAILAQPKKTQKWCNDCVRILRAIPTAFMPISDVLDARKHNSSLEFFQSLPYDNLIIDEASRCLDHKSKRSQAVEALAIKAKRVYLLSGTLCVGRPSDMYMPMTILGRDILGMNWQNFLRRYCILDSRNPHIVRGYQNLDELKMRTDPHIIAKKREDCIDLPDRIFVKRYYEPNKEMCSLYNKIADRNTHSIKIAGYDMPVDFILVKLIKCFQVLNGFLYYGDRDTACNTCDNIQHCVAHNIHPAQKGCNNPKAVKLERKVYHIEDNPKLRLLEEDLADTIDEKTIIWAWYKEDITAIKAMLDSKHIPYVVAGTQDCVQKFNTVDRYRVFLGQTVQGIGITLNAATCTIYYSHGPALEPRLQSMDRNYRIGQTKPVVVKDYLSKGTLEEMLVYLLEHKTDVKEFMQKNTQCFVCNHLKHCSVNKVNYMQEGCVFYGEKRNAEKVKTLQIQKICED